MDGFIKITAGILVALLLVSALSKQGKDISLVLTVAVCCMVAACIFEYLRPVVDFLDELKSIGNIDPDSIGILLKATGIVLLGEITSNICLDAGNTAMSKGVLMVSSAVTLWLSVPLFRNLIEMIEEILVSI